MQIAVLSDLHIGKKNRLDRFCRADEAEDGLIRMLEKLERAVDRVVLLGDVFETLRGGAPGTLASELRGAMAAYPRLTKRIVEDPRYRYVFGNHDVVAKQVLGAPEYLVEEDHGTKIAFFHGHQMDRLARGRAPFSRLGVWMGGVLERAGLPVTHHVDRHKGAPTPDAHKKDLAVYVHGATQIAEQMGADVVVNGHTHRPRKTSMGGQLYLNSGTWLAGRREVVLLDTGAQTYELLNE